MLTSAFAQTPEKQRFGSSIWPLVLGIRPMPKAVFPQRARSARAQASLEGKKSFLAS
jgi:hypothetical protein